MAGKRYSRRKVPRALERAASPNPKRYSRPSRRIRRVAREVPRLYKRKRAGQRRVEAARTRRVERAHRVAQSRRAQFQAGRRAWRAQQGGLYLTRLRKDRAKAAGRGRRAAGSMPGLRAKEPRFPVTSESVTKGYTRGQRSEIEQRWNRYVSEVAEATAPPKLPAREKARHFQRTSEYLQREAKPGTRVANVIASLQRVSDQRTPSQRGGRGRPGYDLAGPRFSKGKLPASWGASDRALGSVGRGVAKILARGGSGNAALPTSSGAKLAGASPLNRGAGSLIEDVAKVTGAPGRKLHKWSGAPRSSRLIYEILADPTNLIGGGATIPLRAAGKAAKLAKGLRAAGVNVDRVKSVKVARDTAIRTGDARALLKELQRLESAHSKGRRVAGHRARPLQPVPSATQRVAKAAERGEGAQYTTGVKGTRRGRLRRYRLGEDRVERGRRLPPAEAQGAVQDTLDASLWRAGRRGISIGLRNPMTSSATFRVPFSKRQVNLERASINIPLPGGTLGTRTARGNVHALSSLKQTEHRKIREAATPELRKLNHALRDADAQAAREIRKDIAALHRDVRKRVKAADKAVEARRLTYRPAYTKRNEAAIRDTIGASSALQRAVKGATNENFEKAIAPLKRAHRRKGDVEDALARVQLRMFEKEDRLAGVPGALDEIRVHSPGSPKDAAEQATEANLRTLYDELAAQGHGAGFLKGRRARYAGTRQYKNPSAEAQLTEMIEGALGPGGGFTRQRQFNSPFEVAGREHLEEDLARRFKLSVDDAEELAAKLHAGTSSRFHAEQIARRIQRRGNPIPAGALSPAERAAVEQWSESDGGRAIFRSFNDPENEGKVMLALRDSTGAQRHFGDELSTEDAARQIGDDIAAHDELVAEASSAGDQDGFALLAKRREELVDELNEIDGALPAASWEPQLAGVAEGGIALQEAVQSISPKLWAVRDDAGAAVKLRVEHDPQGTWAAKYLDRGHEIVVNSGRLKLNARSEQARAAIRSALIHELGHARTIGARGQALRELSLAKGKTKYFKQAKARGAEAGMPARNAAAVLGEAAAHAAVGGEENYLRFADLRRRLVRSLGAKTQAAETVDVQLAHAGNALEGRYAATVLYMRQLDTDPTYAAAIRQWGHEYVTAAETSARAMELLALDPQRFRAAVGDDLADWIQNDILRVQLGDLAPQSLAHNEVVLRVSDETLMVRGKGAPTPAPGLAQGTEPRFTPPRGKSMEDTARLLAAREQEYRTLPDDTLVEVYRGTAGASSHHAQRGTYVTPNWYLAQSYGLGKEPEVLVVRKGDLRADPETGLKTAEDSLFGTGEAIVPHGLAQSADSRGGPLNYSATEPSDEVGGRLPDLRDPDKQLIVDPKEMMYYRAGAQARATAVHAQWKAIDAEYGRSMSHADLERHGGDVDDSRAIWHDASTGQDYIRPVLNNSTPAGRIIGEDRVWPAQLVTDANLTLTRMGEFDIGITTGQFGFVNHMLQHVRFGVTVPFPAYHIRNLASDIIKSLQADSGIIFHPLVTARMLVVPWGKGKAIDVPGIGKMELPDFLLFADMYGVRSGEHLADFASEAVKGQTAIKRWLLNQSGKREDIVRLNTFLQRMRRNGGDAADAAHYMIRHHFDYSDLSLVEKRYVRNVFLFYTWYRKNIPLQLAELVRRPGFFAAVAQTYYELPRAGTPINQDWSKLHPWLPDASQEIAIPKWRPDYITDRLMMMPMSWNGQAAFFGFGAPWADLNFASEEGLVQAGRTMTNPFLQAAFQFGWRAQDPLTGRDYRAAEASNLATAFDSIGVPLSRDKNGRPVLPWYVGVVSNTVPFLGRGSSAFASADPTKDQGRLQVWGKRASLLTGVNPVVFPKAGSPQERKAMEKAYVGLLFEGADEKERVSYMSDKDKAEHMAKWEEEVFIPRAISKGFSRRYMHRSGAPRLPDFDPKIRRRKGKPRKFRYNKKGRKIPLRARPRSGGQIGGGGSVGQIGGGGSSGAIGGS